MKEIIFLGEPDGEGFSFIRDTLSDVYKMVAETEVQKVIQRLDEDATDINAVIIGYPASVTGTEELVSYIQYNNTVIFSIPVLILTDEAHKDEDEKYLQNPVVDVIYRGNSPAVVKNRVHRASQIVNSVSFSEFAKMLQVLPSLIYLKDARGRYVFCTQYWHHLDHYDDPDWTIVGKTDMEIRKDIENAKKAYESDMRIIQSGVGTAYVIEENEDNRQEFLQIIKEPLKYEDGRVRGIIALINDVTEQELLKRKLEKLSFTDDLTGLYNRAYMESYRNTVSKSSYPLSIISADCDNLKVINDKYGHMVGDEYIRMSVMLMRTVLPESSIMCRMGGDEFLIFLPRTSEEKVRNYLDILEKMEGIFKIHDQKLSVSFGAATLNDPNESVDSVIDRSDADMYRNKKGRKRDRT